MTAAIKTAAELVARPEKTEEQRIHEGLSQYFQPDQIGWKPQNTKKLYNGCAIALPYIDARDVMNRLDQVVGPKNWKASFEINGVGSSVTCTLSVRIDGEWIPKQDVGGQSEQDDEGDRIKAAYSDAYKRAAVHWGIGRYLYSIDPIWCKYDEQKRRFSEKPRLPDWAIPNPPWWPKSGQELVRRLVSTETDHVTAGICKSGEFVQWILAAGVAAGHPAEMKDWDDAGIELAFEKAREFAKTRKQAAPVQAAQVATLPPAAEVKTPAKNKVAGKDAVGQGTLMERVERFEQDHINKGQCEKNDLVNYIYAKLGDTYSGRMNAWPEPAIEDVKRELKDWQKQLPTASN